ncbi:MAG: hypothetical protein KIS66_06475 [Fimbriimonadaceae bacterium]|nr:hypothetical protein [Fimbriimonadaceae bacterium]
MSSPFAEKPGVSFGDFMRPVQEVTLSLSTREARMFEAMKQKAQDEGHAQGYETGHQEGYALGYREGYHEARTKALAEIEERERAAELDYVAALNEESAILQRCAAEWFAKAEASLANLAIVIAQRIVCHELEARPETLFHIAKAALAEATASTRVRIRANPFHMDILRTRKDRLLALQPQLRDIELVDDHSILGGCVVESDSGVIDARIETQLENLLRAARGEPA